MKDKRPLLETQTPTEYALLSSLFHTNKQNKREKENYKMFLKCLPLETLTS
jgi:hypothetical protein